MSRTPLIATLGAALSVAVHIGAAAAAEPRPIASGSAVPLSTDLAYTAAASSAKSALRKKHGDEEAERIDRGVDQVLSRWRAADGDAAAFRAFVEGEFIASGAGLEAAFGRFEGAMESLDGYFVSMGRDLRRQVDLDLGPVLPIDDRLAGYDPSAHVNDDLFDNKVAFVGLLNFPLTTLDQRMKYGMGWTREQWAATRLAGRFQNRVPADVQQRISEAASGSAAYIAGYNIYMHHLVTSDGARLFPAGLRLLSHWNLRDDLKARYGDANGLAMQRMIVKVMDRIVRQEIPRAVIDNPLVDWNPETNAVTLSTVKDAEAPEGRAAAAKADREPDERYRQWMSWFKAERLADPYTPESPTFIARRFNVNREIPEPQVRALLESLLASPLGERTGRVIEKRLGRKLESFDIWYAGFKPRAKYQESDLDAMTRKKYPTPAAYAADIPRMLRDLGFAEDRARFVADHIEVDPARGSGHALGASRRDDKAHLRTRIAADGMDYKGYNIAVHEMGHNVEQVFSNTAIDHTLLAGVPNNAFTEALAFVFQARDLALLGLAGADPAADSARSLEEFWGAREIAGAALVDMDSWHWLYDHPEATPAEFREAVVSISKGIWNRHYAPIFAVKDVTLLGIYSHMIDSGLYLPDYPIGHFIAFQVEAHFKEGHGAFGAEFERICRLGSLTPDAWMRQAVGSPLSADPLLESARAALDAMGG
ncbi:MAG TPA: hypothetical protein VE404_01145 [Verrucomicrobiae bacterium]|nr:hypothetical protein [Verrucomicrobiae bacterium]